MSNTPEENAVIEAAKNDFLTYAGEFEKKYGYAIGYEVTPIISVEGYIKLENKLTLVKLNAENPASTPSNGDTQTTETSASDSSERTQA